MILEAKPKGTNGWFLRVDDDRKIIFEKAVRDVDLKTFFKFSSAPVRNVSQKAWEGEHLFKSRRRVIAVADPALATTIPIPLDLPRDPANTKSKIGVAEVENMIAQAMQKIFNGCRAEAARRLALHELDAVLVGAKAEHFKVDGKKLTTPVGFAGKKISLLLELTFTGRWLFEDLKQFFNSSEGDFFFAEAPQAELRALSRVRDLPLNLIVAHDDETSLFVLEETKGGHGVLYREKLAWLFPSLFKAIMEELAVNERTAKELYRTYRKGGLSGDAERAFKRTLEAPLRGLLDAVEKEKVKGTVYLDTPHEPPFALPHRRGAARFEVHPLGELLAELGFTLDIPAFTASGMSEYEALRATLYFLAAYFDKSGSEINQKLRRRLHWLAG